jgi:hypothetical protein
LDDGKPFSSRLAVTNVQLVVPAESIKEADSQTRPLRAQFDKPATCRKPPHVLLSIGLLTDRKHFRPHLVFTQTEMTASCRSRSAMVVDPNWLRNWKA